MSFAKWKKRNTVLNDLVYFAETERPDILRIASAAYKAGERQGRRDVEMIAKLAIAVRDEIANKANMSFMAWKVGQ